jgi:hypothetical protein
MKQIPWKNGCVPSEIKDEPWVSSHTRTQESTPNSEGQNGMKRTIVAKIGRTYESTE